MYFLFSGEGPTDLGSCANGVEQCDGKDYEYGPMTVIVGQIVENQQQYSLLDSENFGFVSKGALTARKSELKSTKKKMGLPGKKRARETRYFFNNARILARFATEKETESSVDVVAILFRDSDGTASAGRGDWETKRRSMLAGFTSEGFNGGVPMIPKPKSEAWIICAMNNVGGDALEERSGNDNSPDSLKSELNDLLEGRSNRETLCEMVEDRTIDFQKIQMPSFLAFRQRLEEVI